MILKTLEQLKASGYKLTTHTLSRKKGDHKVWNNTQTLNKDSYMISKDLFKYLGSEVKISELFETHFKANGILLPYDAVHSVTINPDLRSIHAGCVRDVCLMSENGVEIFYHEDETATFSPNEYT